MSGSMFMPLWTDAYLGDTRHLSTVQHGAYLLILMAMWRNGGDLPDDEKRLARTVGLPLDKWRKISPEVLEFFENEDGVITQNRLRLELKKSLSLAEKRALAGSSGGRAKSLKTKEARVAIATARLEQKGALLIPLPNNHIESPFATQSSPTENEKPQQLDQPAKRKPRSTSVATSRGTRIPDDWRATDDHYEAGQKIGLSDRQIDKEANKFFDYWVAKSGKDATKADWMAAWRSWCRKALEYLGPDGSGQRTMPARRAPAI